MNKENLLSSGGIIAALLTTSCCALPFLLFSAGVSGAWIGKLRWLEPYNTLFMIVAVVLVGAGFYVSRKTRQRVCEDDEYCAMPTAGRIHRVLLWGSVMLIALSLMWPTIVRVLMGSSS